VAQVSRTVARALRLNEDLTEAIALAHDLGHPPFGHEGEEALDEVCASTFRTSISVTLSRACAWWMFWKRAAKV
jgi:dGTPase